MSLRARLDPHARRLSGGRLYLAYQLRGEHVATVDSDLKGVEIFLRGNGYERSPSVGPVPLEAAKRRHDGDRTHDLSLRRVDPQNERRQFHVHLWADGDGVDVHSHLEYRPDLKRVAGESWREAYDRLREHYRPSWGVPWGDGVTYVPGAYCDVVDVVTR